MPKILKIRQFKALLSLSLLIVKVININFLEFITQSYFMLLWYRWSNIKSVRNVLHPYFKQTLINLLKTVDM